MAATSSVSSVYQLEASKPHKATKGRYGCLQFPDGSPGLNEKIALFVRNRFGTFKYGKAETNEEGRYVVKDPKTAIATKWDHNFVLKVMRPNRFREKGSKKEYAIAEIDLPFNLKGEAQDLGVTLVTYAGFQKGLPIREVPGTLPPKEMYPYLGSIVKVAVDDQIKSVILKALPCTTIPMVESVIGVGDPSLKPTPENVVEMLLNGIRPGKFKKTENPDVYLVNTNWDNYERDISPVLVNSKVYVNNDNGNLSIRNIDLQFPGDPWENYGPDHPDFERVVKLVNSNLLFEGELKDHLGTHFVVGQVATAADRFIKKNPVGSLLFAFLKAVEGIGKFGEDPIFGENGILNVAGLKIEGINAALGDVFAACDPTSFEPSKPINNKHVLAMGSNLFWSIADEFVEFFFADPENKKGILEHWPEIYYYSKYSVESSMKHRPEDGEYDSKVWVDPSEISDPSGVGRVKVNGEIKSIRPITQSKSAPAEGDMAKLKQLCKWVIFKASWWHWVIHSSQKKWATNLKFATLAPEGHGEGEYCGTKLDNAIKQMAIATILTDFEVEEGKLLNNYYGDISQVFINMLLDRELEFKRLGFDIRKLFYGIII